MNELTTGTQQLPDTLEDLNQFVLVGKAKLQAYMLKLQTINRLSTAQEIRDQTLQETQELSTALIAAEQRIGELLLAIPKASGQYAESENRPTSKNTLIRDMGYTKDEASDYQQMAKNPEIVQKVIEDALANGEIITKASVMREIKFYKDRIKELQSQEPKVKTVEVVPDDYEALKKKAKEASAYKQDYKREQDKVTEKQREILALKDRIAELEGATQEGLEHANLSENIFYFCAICNNFISNVGGLVWLTERIADMPKKEKEMFLKAARSFTDWSLVFKDNLERSLNEREETGTSGIDPTIPLLID